MCRLFSMVKDATTVNEMFDIIDPLSNVLRMAGTMRPSKDPGKQWQSLITLHIGLFLEEQEAHLKGHFCFVSLTLFFK